MWDYVVDRRGQIAYQALQRVSLVVQGVLLGTVIALAVTMAVYRSPRPPRWPTASPRSA